MITYTKEADKIYMVTTTKTLIDLDALKSRKVELEALTRPPDKELIESGKYAYEFFVRDDLIAEIDEKIKELEVIK